MMNHESMCLIYDWCIPISLVKHAAVMPAPYDNNCSKDIRKDDLFMNIHERSRTVREQRIVGEHVTLNAKIVIRNGTETIERRWTNFCQGAQIALCRQMAVVCPVPESAVSVSRFDGGHLSVVLIFSCPSHWCVWCHRPLHNACEPFYCCSLSVLGSVLVVT